MEFFSDFSFRWFISISSFICFKKDDLIFGFEKEDVLLLKETVLLDFCLGIDKGNGTGTGTGTGIFIVLGLFIDKYW